MSNCLFSESDYLQMVSNIQIFSNCAGEMIDSSYACLPWTDRMVRLGEAYKRKESP